MSGYTGSNLQVGVPYRWKKSVDRAIEGEEGCVSERRPMGGRLLVEDTRHRTP